MNALSHHVPTPGPGSAGDEETLWALLKSSASRTAREKLFLCHARFARNIARRLFRERSWGDLEIGDLYQLAYVGLLEAVDRFDPGRGTPFRAFAAQRITGSVLNGLVRMSEMREQMGWRAKLHYDRMRSLTDPKSGPVTGSEFDHMVEVATGLAVGFMLEETQLFAHEDETAGANVNNTAYDTLVWEESLGKLREMLSRLPDREQIILRLHYLNGVNFEQIGEMLSISKGRVSQLHRAALSLLRKRLQQREPLKVI